jgi:hypothetical protein
MRSICQHFERAENGAYETYSFSLFVIRTSGSLPRRPIRMSLETSDERDTVEENAYGVDEDLWRRNGSGKIQTRVRTRGDSA